MSEYPTDRPEFIDAVIALPGQYEDRLSPENLRWLRDAAEAGEWGEALDSLVAGLAELGSLVTPAERDQLAELYRTAGIDADLLDELTVRG